MKIDDDGKKKLEPGDIDYIKDWLEKTNNNIRRGSTLTATDMICLVQSITVLHMQLEEIKEMLQEKETYIKLKP